MNALHSVPIPVDPTRGSAILHHIHQQDWTTVASHLRTKRSARRRVRLPSPDGVTVLHCAAWLGGAPGDVIDLLVKAHPKAARGVDASWGFTPLHMATYSDRASLEAVTALVRAYPPACAVRDHQKLTPLHRVCLVATTNLHTLARVLLEADPSQVRAGIRKPSRDCPFHLAMARAHYELQRTRCEALRGEAEGKACHEAHEALESIVEAAFLCRKVEMILDERDDNNDNEEEGDDGNEEQDEAAADGTGAVPVAEVAASSSDSGSSAGFGAEAATTGSEGGGSATSGAAAATEGEGAEAPPPPAANGGGPAKRRRLRPAKLKKKLSTKVSQKRLQLESGAASVKSKLGLQAKEQQQSTEEVPPPTPLDEPLTFPDRVERAAIFRASLLKAECPNIRLFLYLALWNYPELAAAELEDYSDEALPALDFSEILEKRARREGDDAAPCGDDVREDMEACAATKEDVARKMEQRASDILRQPTDVADDCCSDELSNEDDDDFEENDDDARQSNGDALQPVDEDCTRGSTCSRGDEEGCDSTTCGDSSAESSAVGPEGQDAESSGDNVAETTTAAPSEPNVVSSKQPLLPRQPTQQELDSDLNRIAAIMKRAGIKDPHSTLPDYASTKPPTLLHAALSRAKSSVGDAHWCVACRRGLVDPHFVSQDTGESCDVTCAHRYITKGELREMRRAAGIEVDVKTADGSETTAAAMEEQDENGAAGADDDVDQEEDDDDSEDEEDEESSSYDGGSHGYTDDEDESDDNDSIETDEDEDEDENCQQAQARPPENEGVNVDTVASERDEVDQAAAASQESGESNEDGGDNANAGSGNVAADEDDDADEEEQQVEDQEQDQVQEEAAAAAGEQVAAVVVEEEDPNEETTWYRTCRDRLYKDITVTMPYGNIIARLASMYPQSSAIPFPSHGGASSLPRLPLHAAVAGGHTWYGGVQAIVRSHPPALSLLDPLLGIYPFMGAGMRKPNPPGDDDWERKRYFSELTTCYELLRELPELVTRHL